MKKKRIIALVVALMLLLLSVTAYADRTRGFGSSSGKSGSSTGGTTASGSTVGSTSTAPHQENQGGFPTSTQYYHGSGSTTKTPIVTTGVPVTTGYGGGGGKGGSGKGGSSTGGSTPAGGGTGVTSGGTTNDNYYDSSSSYDSYSPPPPPPPSSDMGVASLSSTSYWRALPAIVGVTVSNSSYTTDSCKVEARVKDMNGEWTTLTAASPDSDTVSVAAYSSNVALFQWTPALAAAYTIEINLRGAAYESNTANNHYEATLTVSARKKVQDAVSSVDAAQPAQGLPTSIPAGENNPRTEWTVNGTSYWAELGLEAKITDPTGDTMKSGYGFEMTVKTAITTNYTKDSRHILFPQEVCVFIPEARYLKAVKMVTADEGKTWTLPVNTASVVGAKRWYVPVWFPDDKDYIVLVTALGAYTPGGEMTKSGTASIRIKGNMYEDDYTANY